MASKKIGFSKMYMVPPSVWELVKKCVNEHEQKNLENLNKTHDTSIPENKTSETIHNISSRDITPLESNISKNISRDSQIPMNLDESQTSFHRSQDRSRSILEHDITPLPHQISLPHDSFFDSDANENPENSFSKINLSRQSFPSSSNTSQINLSRQSFPSSDTSFGQLPKPEKSHQSFSSSDASQINLSRQSFPSFDTSFGKLPKPEEFKPPRTSTPIEHYDQFIHPINPSPINNGPIIPVKPFPHCTTSTSSTRSPIKTRTRTGALPTKTPQNNMFMCEYCNKYFTRKWNLKKHILTAHRQEVLPNPDESYPTNFKRKLPTHFKNPAYKTRKRTEFDRWNLNE